MSQTLSLSTTTPPIAEIVERLGEGEEMIFTKDDIPVAVLTRRTTKTTWPSEPGTAKQYAFWMSDDFNDPVDDVEEIFP